jgi:hypothetical protein
METIVVLECGSTVETGMSDEQADTTLAETVSALHFLADQVDAAGGAFATYPRDQFESNGVEPEGVIPEMDTLEDPLGKLGQGKGT